jgi:hypothetical protein
MRTHALWVASVLAAGIGLADAALAQTWSVADDDDWCHREKWNADFCEVREITLPADREVIEVDGGKNGGIAVHGWDQDEIRLQVKVQVWDIDAEEAGEYASSIEIKTDGAVIEADGPSRGDGPNWSVSYRLRVPRESSLALDTHNGGITILDVSGSIEFSAKNGGIRLAQVGGDVHGATKNGGLTVVLTGDAWRGAGLDVETTNGGIDLEVPESYSARLLLSTVNGGIRADFPVTVSGRRSKSIRATIGDGGPLIRLATKNGGVSVRGT